MYYFCNYKMANKKLQRRHVKELTNSHLWAAKGEEQSCLGTPRNSQGTSNSWEISFTSNFIPHTCFYWSDEYTFHLDDSEIVGTYVDKLIFY